MGIESIIVFLIVGAIAGWLAGLIVSGGGFGLIGNIVIGIIGAVIAGTLFPYLGVSLGSGIIAAIIVPRVTVSSDTAKQKVNAHNKATINASVERYNIETGAWPANDLSDIGANTNYFPDGVPVNPVTGTAYTLNATTHRVN